MARERSPNRDKAFEIYKEHDGDIANRKIAEILQISEKTVGGWKTKDKWVQKLNGVLRKNEQSTPKENMEYSEKRGAPKGNKNSVGNKGGSAPRGNSNAVKHGLFRKYLPKEIFELKEELEEAFQDPVDMVYESIMILFTQIVYAQPIMFVTDKNEMIKELKKAKYDTVGNKKDGYTSMLSEEEYEFQFAWDRQATFMNSQARVMSELRSLIKQFLEIADKDDERRLKLEQMRVNIEKTKADIEKVKGKDDDKPIEIVISRKKKGEERD